jgi:hypothetical protein
LEAISRWRRQKGILTPQKAEKVLFSSHKKAAAQSFIAQSAMKIIAFLYRTSGSASA